MKKNKVLVCDRKQDDLEQTKMEMMKGEIVC